MSKKSQFGISVFSVIFAFAFLFCGVSSSYGQGGNTVTGQVVGFENKPLYDVTVELLDDYSRLQKYTKTDGSGRYFFSAVRAGRYSVRVRPIEPEYEEQEQSGEIVNFTRTSQQGTVSSSGMDNQQLDFRLRLKKGFVGVTAVLFVQEVPANAKKFYEQALLDFTEKRDREALVNLRASIEAFPKYFAALERLGTEYVKIKQFEASATLLQLAVGVNPRSYRSWYGLSYSLNSLEYYDEALAAVKKALDLFPSSAESALLAGVIYKSKKDTSGAETQFLKAKELSNDTLPMANWYLALLYGNEMKRYAAAARELKLFLKKQPESKDAEKIKQLILNYEEKAKSS